MNSSAVLAKSNYNSVYSGYKANNSININNNKSNSAFNAVNYCKNKRQVTFGIAEPGLVTCLADFLIIASACFVESHLYDKFKAKITNQPKVLGTFFDHGASIFEKSTDKFYGSIHNTLAEIDKLKANADKKPQKAALESIRTGFEKILSLSTQGFLGKEASEKISAKPNRFIKQPGAEGILEACQNIKIYLTTVAESLADKEPDFYQDALKHLLAINKILSKISEKAKQI